MPLCNAIYSNHTDKNIISAYEYGFGKGQMCAMDFVGRNDSCAGDGGGPLQVFIGSSDIATIVGIVSFGVSPCGSMYPSVYTRVAHYLDWIVPIVYLNSTTTDPEKQFFQPRIMDDEIVSRIEPSKISI